LGRARLIGRLSLVMLPISGSYQLALAVADEAHALRRFLRSKKLERVTRLELATSSLARRCSTTELHPQIRRIWRTAIMSSGSGRASAIIFLLLLLVVIVLVLMLVIDPCKAGGDGDRSRARAR
jgi:hypothetical protein